MNYSLFSSSSSSPSSPCPVSRSRLTFIKETVAQKGLVKLTSNQPNMSFYYDTSNSCIWQVDDLSTSSTIFNKPIQDINIQIARLNNIRLS